MLLLSLQPCAWGLYAMQQHALHEPSLLQRLMCSSMLERNQTSGAVHIAVLCGYHCRRQNLMYARADGHWQKCGVCMPHFHGSAALLYGSHSQGDIQP